MCRIWFPINPSTSRLFRPFLKSLCFSETKFIVKSDVHVLLHCTPAHRPPMTWYTCHLKAGYAGTTSLISHVLPMASYTCLLTNGHAGSTSFISHVLPLTSSCWKMRLQTCIKVKTEINQSQFQIYPKNICIYIYIISSLVEEAWYHQFLYDSLILSEYCLLFLEGFLATNIKIPDVS